MASNQSLTRTFQALLTRWPADLLRPTAHLGTVLSTRLSQTPPPPRPPSSSAAAASSSSSSSSAAPKDAQVRATAALLDDVFAKKYAPRPDRSASGGGKEGFMRPRSNPEYYKVLMRELEELPTRSWWDRAKIRVGAATLTERKGQLLKSSLKK